MRLYHGSPVSGIKNLETTLDTTVGDGIYFMSSPAAAMGYAQIRAKDRNRNAVADSFEPVVYGADITNARIADLRNDENVTWLPGALQFALVEKLAKADSWIDQGRINLGLQ